MSEEQQYISDEAIAAAFTACKVTTTSDKRATIERALLSVASERPLSLSWEPVFAQELERVLDYLRLVDPKDGKIPLSAAGRLMLWQTYESRRAKRAGDARAEISNEKIAEAFKGTRFGVNPDYRRLLHQGVLQITCGYRCGSTLRAVMIELGLISSPRSGDRPTKLGKLLLMDAFYDRDSSG